MNRLLLLLPVLLSLLVPRFSSAQVAPAAVGSAKAQYQPKTVRTISGVVTDNSGIITGATVYLQNKEQRVVAGAVTGVQGEYLLNVPNIQDLSIVVGFVGYKTVTIPYTGQTIYNIKIVEDVVSLAEVAVIGYKSNKNHMGIERDDLGTATQSIDVTEFENMSVTSLEDMIQGKLANTDILAASGDPGTGATIRIRGTASLNASNEPLIVIDGIPQDSGMDPEFNFGDANVEDFGALVNISPADIQSIEVLKDAAATALWGPKAANGVLLITTKSGGVHKPRFSFSQKFNYTFEPKQIPLLNGQEYTTLMQDALWNWIKDGNYASNRMNKLTNQRDILYDRSYEYFDEFNTNTNWVDLITTNSMNSTTDFSMDGGGEKASYRFSLGYEDQNGTTRNTGYDRITSRLNMTINFSKKFKVTSRFSYVEATRNQIFGSTNNDLNIDSNADENNQDQNAIWSGVSDAVRRPIRNTAMRKMPNMSPWVLDENGNPTDEYFAQPTDCLQSTLPNLLAMVNESLNETKMRTVSANFSTNYVLFKGLTVRGTIAFTMSTVRNNSFLPSSVLNVKWSNSMYNMGIEAVANKSQTYGEVAFTYNANINKKHRIVLNLADQFETTNNNAYAISNSGNGATQVSTPSSSGKITAMSSGLAMRRTMGVIASVNYNFKDLYSVVFSARMNANSNTGSANNWTPRPSLQANWKMHREPFMKGTRKWLDELRWRASYGRSDRVPDASYLMGTFAYEDPYMDRDALKQNRIQLNYLKPETVTQYNFGFDVNILKNKFNLTAEYYSKKTTDLLQRGYRIVTSSGFQNVPWFNSGSILNHGFEVMLNLNNIVTAGKWKFSLVNINISRNINEILSLPDNEVATQYVLGNGNYARKAMEGNPIGSIYGFRFEGIYQNYEETLARDAQGNLIRDINGNTVPIRIGGTWRQRPGDVKYADLNYDGIIDQYDIVYLGSSFPTVTGGATLRIEYGPWMLRLSTHARLGQSIVNAARRNMESMNSGDNQARTTLNRWRYEGDQTDIPRALWSTNYNTLGSSRFVEDGSFLKIKDITINYRVPEKITRKIGISRANFFITSYNLLCFTNYTGQDPEIGVGNKVLAIATDESRTPPSRRMAAGLSFDF